MNSKRLLVLLCLAVAGCGADNGSSIAIIGRAVTPTATAGTGCLFTVGTYQIGPGLLDLEGTLSYGLPLEVDNNLVDPASGGLGVTGAKSWSAQRVRTRVLSSAGFSPALVTVASESIAPADSTSIPAAGKQVLFLNVIGPELGAMIKARAGSFSGLKSLQLGITLLGHTADGAALDTAEKTYPLDVCAGCLVAAPTCVAPKAVVRAPSCFEAGQDQSAFTCQ